MSKRSTKILIWLTALAVIMACVPTFSTPAPVPTLDPGAINTYIALTAEVAATQTAAAIPTLTPSITLTSTPRFTKTPEPSATNTFIWIAVSPTSLGAALTVTSNKSYACDVISATPANGTNFDPRKSFDAKWSIKNIGKKEWDKNDADFIYVSGDKLNLQDGYDFKKTVGVGVTVDLTVAMQARKNPGTYTTNWAIRIGSNQFCNVSLRIVVK